MTFTPVPPAYKISWSASSLSSFTTCPRQFYHAKIAKDAVEPPPHPKTTYGLLVHEALEVRGKTGKALPQDLAAVKAIQAHSDIVDKLVAHGDSAVFEHKMGATKTGQPCGFYDPDVYSRAISDVLITYESENTMLVVDHKLGSYRGKTMQPIINAYHVFAENPEINVVRTLFSYVLAGVNDRSFHRRHNFVEDFAPVAAEVKALEDAVAYENFPAKRNGLCKNYCSAVKCPHNGRYKHG